MISEKCNLHDLNGIKQLERVEPYLVITNRWRYETSKVSRYVLINETQSWVYSVHGSQYAAVIFARKYG